MTYTLAPPILLTAPIRVRCWGERAIFTRYETPIERDTYPIITPNAADGLLKNIYWHPGVDYEISRIHVMKPVATYPFYGKELKNHPAKGKPTTSESNRTLKLMRFIHQPEYIIEARMTLDPQIQTSENHAKYMDIFEERLARGACYKQPYFGMREFWAHFEEMPYGAEIRPWDADADLGQLPLYLEFRPNAKGESHYQEFIRAAEPDEHGKHWVKVARRGDVVPHFFRAQVQRGTLHVPPYREGL